MHKKNTLPLRDLRVFVPFVVVRHRTPKATSPFVTFVFVPFVVAPASHAQNNTPFVSFVPSCPSWWPRHRTPKTTSPFVSFVSS